MSDSLDKILERVRQLIEKAEFPISPGATDAERQATLIEQKAARDMADALIFKYKVEEATARNARPAEQRKPPNKLDIELGSWDSDILGYFYLLSRNISSHCDCIIRSYTKSSGTSTYSTVYGFESGLGYFNILYTTVRLHMVGILVPRIDPQLSLDENCFLLHNAGYNWLDIGAMYGWHRISRGESKYRNDHVDEVWTGNQVGGKFKRAYYRACEAHGVKPQIISASGTAAYRRSAAEGYTSMISQRLREMRSGRSAGSELVLKGGMDDLRAYFRQENPDLFVVRESSAENKPARQRRTPKYVEPRFDSRAYAVGANYAKTADLGTGRTETGQQQRGIA